MKFVNFSGQVSVHIQNEKVGSRDHTLCGKWIGDQNHKKATLIGIRLFLVELPKGKEMYLRTLCKPCSTIASKLIEAQELSQSFKVVGVLQ